LTGTIVDYILRGMSVLDSAQAPPAQLRDFGLWIGGEEVASTGDTRLEVVNPSTGRPWSTLADATVDDVNSAVESAAEASRGEWSKRPSMRIKALLRLADLIEEHAPRLAELDVQDNGKIIRESTTQITFTHQWYRYYAGLADKIHGQTVSSERDSAFNFTVREPLGVIACITAWNSPLLLAAVKLAPALAAGNTVVLKPSEFASSSTLEYARLCSLAGMPPGVVNVVTGGGATAGSTLVEHPDVAHVSFTGSPGTGARIAAAAGAQLKGVTLELGGKSPNIIFDDADLDAACVGVLGGIFAAAGQSCVAGSRVLVHRPVYDEVLERLRSRAESIVVGDPLDPATEMGPIANQPQLDKIEHYVKVGVDDGARLVTGGSRLNDGLYFQPTIFAEVADNSTLAQEEVFGPIMAVIPFEDEAEAVRIANNSPYGLAAGVWTANVSRAHRMAKHLQSGTVFVNTYRAMAPNMPVGGYKESGLGRENGIDAILDFTQVKSVWIETEPSVVDPFKMRF
jgi:acyl-CoA reductase-like NAD-dependent aldehyde dehydrogenase